MDKTDKNTEPETASAVDAIVSGCVCDMFSEQITNGIGGFKVWEDREFVVHSDRDKAIVEWTIRCLANPDNPLTGRVLHEITMQRLRESGHKVASAVDAVEIVRPSFEEWLDKYFQTPKMKMMYKRKDGKGEHDKEELLSRYKRAYRSALKITTEEDDLYQAMNDMRP